MKLAIFYIVILTCSQEQEIQMLKNGVSACPRTKVKVAVKNFRDCLELMDDTEVVYRLSENKILLECFGADDHGYALDRIVEI